MTARPGEKTRQGPKFLTDFVSKHFIEGDGFEIRERIGGMFSRRADDEVEDDEERTG